jgi:AAHS family 4-hydroxybenzoate transporter-like MFS transporter
VGPVKPATAVLDVRQFIDEQPLSAYQVLVTFICAFIVFIDGFDAQAMGYVAPRCPLICRFPDRFSARSFERSGRNDAGGAHLRSSRRSLRRKPVLVLSALTFGIGSLLTATAQSVETLSLLRVLTGIGMGGAMPNAIALTSEYMPQRTRATGVMMMMCGFSLGAAWEA